MTLLEQIEDLWNQGAETKAARWVEKLSGAKEYILSAKQQFREWKPLKVYLCYTDAIRREPKFSLRYLGQEVATLRVKANDVSIRISKKTAAANSRLFEMHYLPGPYKWRGAKAQEFRKHFQSLNPRDYHSRVKSEEHHVESEFLRQMKKTTGNKFDGKFKGIQPVTLGGFPFQFPVPISGYKECLS